MRILPPKRLSKQASGMRDLMCAMGAQASKRMSVLSSICDSYAAGFRQAARWAYARRCKKQYHSTARVTTADRSGYRVLTMAGIPERKVVITDNPVEGNYGEGAVSANALTSAAVVIAA